MAAIRQQATTCRWGWVRRCAATRTRAKGVLVGGLAALLLASSSSWPAGASDAAENPYRSISERNSFGLRPRPPAPVVKAMTPANPPAQVRLTGLITVLGRPRALLEVTELQGGKPMPVRKPILSEGERAGPVQVLGINMAKNLVRIRNGSIETNITFEPLKPQLLPKPLPTPRRLLRR